MISRWTLGALAYSEAMIPLTVATFLGLLTLPTILLVAGAVLVAVGALASSTLADARAWLVREYGSSAVRMAWVVSIAATSGSLYFSEGAGFVPCELCWFQRVAMYPLVVVLGVAAFRENRLIRWYAAPLAGAGALVSLYHYALQRLPAIDAGTCASGVPCSLTWFNVFGFISIPLMALTAFGAILVLLLVVRREPLDSSS